MAEELNNWIDVDNQLPEPLETIFISDGKGWTTLGCRVEMQDGWL